MAVPHDYYETQKFARAGRTEEFVVACNAAQGGHQIDTKGPRDFCTCVFHVMHQSEMDRKD